MYVSHNRYPVQKVTVEQGLKKCLASWERRFPPATFLANLWYLTHVSVATLNSDSCLNPIYPSNDTAGKVSDLHMKTKVGSIYDSISLLLYQTSDIMAKNDPEIG